MWRCVGCAVRSLAAFLLPVRQRTRWLSNRNQPAFSLVYSLDGPQGRPRCHLSSHMYARTAEAMRGTDAMYYSAERASSPAAVERVSGPSGGGGRNNATPGA